MFSFFSSVLSDKKGGAVFTCFSFFHILLIAVFAVLAVLMCSFLKRKGGDQEKAITRWINMTFGLYILDFFLMPLAYGEIDIEKLPFHACTAMCVMCFFSRHHSFFKRFRLQFAMLGFLSNTVYLIYPAGVMWHAVHPLSYRVIQTLLFHGMMMVYGALVLVLESREFSWKNCRKDLIVILAMTAWAWLGNMLYNSEARVYNWFFVVRDPFYLLPESVAPYVMPLMNITVFFLAELLLYAGFSKSAMRLTAKKK